MTRRHPDPSTLPPDHPARDPLHHALMDLVGILSRPQPDEKLISEAGVALDRALFPLLVRIGLYGPLGVVELAEIVGRDHSTISRQLSRMEELGLIERTPSPADQRVREARVTETGRRMVASIGAARNRLYDKVQEDWPPEDRAALPRLIRCLADDMARVLLAERTGEDPR